MLFGYQDVLEVINNRVTTLIEGATDAHQYKHKDDKTKDFKAVFLIHQCVDADNFEKVGDCESLKQYGKSWRRHMHDMIRQRL